MRKNRAPVLTAWALLVLAAAPLSAQDAGAWKYKYLAVVVQNSGAHRPNGPALVELLNRLAAVKPAGARVGLFGFAAEFRQLEEARFSRRAARLLEDTADGAEIREAVRELVFNGPSPVFDALADALDAAARAPQAAVLLVSNGVDNASDVTFDDITGRCAKAGVPVIAFYFPTKPPLNGESRLRKLAKVSGGRFIDVRVKDSWEQLVSALRQ